MVIIFYLISFQYKTIRLPLVWHLSPTPKSAVAWKGGSAHTVEISVSYNKGFSSRERAI